MASLRASPNVARQYLKRAKEVLTSSFDYILPAGRIASRPLPDRSSSKLLVVRGSADAIEDRKFTDLPTLLPPGCMIVMNSSKVIPARIPMQKASGGRAELMLLSPVDVTEPSRLLGSEGWQHNWKCYLGGRRIRVGDELRASLPQSGQGLELLATVLDKSAQSAVVSFRLGTETTELRGGVIDLSTENVPLTKQGSITFGDALELAGRIPLPPYIKRKADVTDEVQYQTVYADVEGSVAAPTAGLHMTEDVLNMLGKRGIDIAQVTLHVSAGTFAQVDGERIESHSMHEERIGVSRHTLEKLVKHTRKRSPIVALGTTSVRTLESLYWFGVRILRNDSKDFKSLRIGQWEPYEQLDILGESNLPTTNESYEAVLKWTTESGRPIFGETKLLIVPGYPFKAVDAIVTNFHQPKSTLLMLVSAFLGGSPEELFQVYYHALASDYRFLSYGDSSIYAHPGFLMTKMKE